MEKHYSSDLERLESIKESGTAFAYIQDGICPLCGTPPAEQTHKEECDGDVAAIVQSATAEIEKIKVLKSELTKTRADLVGERRQLTGQIEKLTRSVSELTHLIDNLLNPGLGQRQFSFREVADKRASVGRDLEVYRHLERLKQQRSDLLEEESTEPGSENVATDLSKSVLADFSKIVEKILVAWNFPSAGQVYFDEKSRDFVIAGKPRGSFGKGFRAITHAAVTIGLMEFCFRRKLAHPGVVILDSPLLAYWKPEGTDDSLVGSDLKDRFFKYICAKKFPGQIIVIENEHPTTRLDKDASKIDFTRNPKQGRYGFFPIASSN